MWRCDFCVGVVGGKVVFDNFGRYATVFAELKFGKHTWRESLLPRPQAITY